MNDSLNGSGDPMPGPNGSLPLPIMGKGLPSARVIMGIVGVLLLAVSLFVARTATVPHGVVLVPYFPPAGNPPVSAGALQGMVDFKYNAVFLDGGKRIPGFSPSITAVQCLADLPATVGQKVACTARSGGREVKIGVAMVQGLTADSLQVAIDYVMAG